MRKRLLFIFNPYSGKGKIKNFLFDIVDIFTKADYEVTVFPTQNAGDCTERVGRLNKEFDIIVISGGDGTLKEAVSGMLALPPGGQTAYRIYSRRNNERFCIGQRYSENNDGCRPGSYCRSVCKI